MALFGRRKPGFSKEVALKPSEIPGEFSDALDPAVTPEAAPPQAEIDTLHERATDTLPDMKAFVSFVFGRIIGMQHQDNKYDNIVSQLKNYIEDHLSKELSRGTLAAQVYLSEDYMSKIFSRITGRPLMAYISDRRMEKAKELLLATELPVSRVAMEVGFTNFSYFSKMFRTYTGSTPNEYRSRKKRI